MGMRAVLFLLLTSLFAPCAFCQSAPAETGEAGDKNLFFRALDWLESLPISFDVGCDPTDDYGATLFGSIEYRWKPDISTQLFWEWANEQKIIRTFSAASDEIEDSSRSQLLLTFFPVKKAVSFAPLPRHTFSFGLGARFESSDTETNSFLNYQDELSAGSAYFRNSRVRMTQHLYGVGPCVELDYSFPIFRWLTVNSENSFALCYFHAQSNISTTHAGAQEMPGESTADDTFGSVFLDIKVHLDFFKFIGLVAQYNLEKIPMNYLFYDNSDNFRSEQYDYVMQKFRFGAALIATHKNYVRIQTGFYRQHEWVSNHAGDTTHTGKWVLSVAAGF